MPRKKQAKQEEMPLSIPEPAAPATPEGQAVLEALRSNLALLGELAARYEVAFQPERPADMPQINCPQDVHTCWGRRCPPWPRSSCGCCCSTPATR